METSLSSCRHMCTHLGILIVGEVEERKELKNLLMWGKFFFYVMVDRELFTYVKNKKQPTLIVNKKFKIVNGAVWSSSLLFNPLIVWNNGFGVDVPLAEKPGG